MVEEKFMKKKIFIVGRSGSGKDTYAKILEKMGYKGVCSYTTRKRRPNEGDTHRFISKEDVDKYPNKIAYTEINGESYFATKEQLEEADFYIIDPNGIDYIDKNFPEIDYKIVYIYANTDIRLQRALSRINDLASAQKEAEIFESRNASEDAQFSNFEKTVLSRTNITIHNNNFNNLEVLEDIVKSDMGM